jgi:hypothetical protein
MMTIMCACGATLTINKMKGSREDVPVVQQCSSCMIAAYDVGYIDGAATETEKTTLADIVAATGRTTI